MILSSNGRTPTIHDGCAGSSPARISIWSLRLKGRTPDSHSGNAGFKSRRDHQFLYVGGSSNGRAPECGSGCCGFKSCSSTQCEHVSEWAKEAGCNPVIRWFESSRALQYGKVAQMVERSVEARKVAGSMPAFTTIYNGE